MLDRLISGAGAVTDAADRTVRAIGRGGGESLLGHRPGSLVVAGICAILAVILLFVGFEATDNPTALAMTPSQIEQSGDLGSRTYVTVAGSVANGYVETYADENGNGTQEDGEDGESWYFFLVDPATNTGVTVRSATDPDTLFQISETGVLVEDAAYVAEDLEYFAQDAAALGFEIDPTHYVDATGDAGTGQAVDFATALPAAGTTVTVTGQGASYVYGCSVDTDGDGACDEAEADFWDIAVYDAASGKALIVVVDEDPEYTPATFTGMLRRDENSVSEAVTTQGLEFSSMGIDVSETYLLDDGSAPASAPVAFGLAGLLGLLAGVILIGLAGGYLVYRKATGSLPEPATSLAVGERLPVRVTGVLRGTGGLIHVREAAADLVRFQTADPVVTAASPDEEMPAADATMPDAGGPMPAAVPSAADGSAPVESTLIIERRGKPEGVAVGLGELTRLSRGDAFPFRGRKPAVRATAGTGPLILSFDSVADRDRAAAELLDETGLTIGESGSAHV